MAGPIRTGACWLLVPVLLMGLGIAWGQEAPPLFQVVSSSQGATQFVLQPLSGAKVFGIRLFREFQPPQRVGDDPPRTLVGRSLVGGLSVYRDGGWTFTVGQFRSGWVAPEPLFSAAQEKDLSRSFALAPQGFRFQPPSAFDSAPTASALTLWKGSLRHTGVGYQSPSGHLRLSYQMAEAEPTFFVATGASDQGFAEATGLAVPLSGLAGLKVRQGEFSWKPDATSRLGVFGVTASQAPDVVTEGRRWEFEGSGIKIGLTGLRLQGVHKMPPSVQAGQVGLANRFLASTSPSLTPLTVTQLTHWSDLEVKSTEFVYEDSPLKWTFARRDLSGSGGAVKEEKNRLSLGGGLLSWERDRSVVAPGSNPEALRLLNAAPLIPLIGWQASRESLNLKFSDKDSFAREERRFSRQGTVISSSVTQGTLLSGLLTFKESRSRLDRSGSQDFVKAIGWENLLNRYGWASLTQDLTFALSSDDRFRFQRLKHETQTARLERTTYGLVLDSGKLVLERIRQDASSGVSLDALKQIGAQDFTATLGWKETRDRLSWQPDPKYGVILTKGQAVAGTSGEGPAPERSFSEADVTWKGSSDTAGQLVIGGWRLTTSPDAPPVTHRHLAFQQTLSIPALSGLRLTVIRQLAEKKAGDKEEDTRLHRTIVEAPKDSKVQFTVDRTTQEQSGSGQKETLKTKVAIPLTDGIVLTSALDKMPTGGGSVTTRDHRIQFRLSPQLSIATGVSIREDPKSRSEEKQFEVIQGEPGKRRTEWRIQQVVSGPDSGVKAQGWRLGWLTQNPSGVTASAQFGRLEKGQEERGEEKLHLEIPARSAGGVGLRVGYWRLGLLKDEARAAADQFSKEAKAGEQPVPQAGV
ncbi:MAG: hypothetical protein NZ959_12200, partial [Armatimonadetes bacterium]|nr:hypothetical protein [Armatimonadota bacterium]MDW8123047.1 hypothetical protein [Armatimonadota bacterium]